MSLKKRIAQGEPVVGTFVHLFSPALIEMIGYAGFDFIIIDNEHGGFTDNELEHLIRAAENSRIVPIIRVSSNPDSIQKALDRGAKGIQVPMVNSKADAELIVRRAKFPPIGNRGTTYSIRPAKYGKTGGRSYLEQANDDLLIIAQIESEEGANQLESILSVPDIDVAFIGPLDLAISTGFDGAQDSEIIAQVKELAARAKAVKKPVGTIAPTKNSIQYVLQNGFSYVVGVTNSMIYEGLDGYISNWKSCHKK